MRWAIVRQLREATSSARALAETVGISPTLLSHHLKVLRQAGLIIGTRRGRWIDYTIDPNALVVLAAVLEA